LLDGGAGDGGFGLTQRIPNTTCRFEGDPAGLPALTAERVFPGLTFTSPVFLTYPPDGTDRIFVVQQRGQIRVFPNRADVATTTTFLDISARVLCCGEEGLLGLAFHPRYSQNRYFYVYYSAASPRRSVISRFEARADDPNRADATTERILLEVPQPFSNHNGGWMGFGPDGYLYIGLGDGGSRDDPNNNGQSLSTLLGKILRIDVDREQSPTVRYSVPADNPFVGVSGARGEIWAYGLRNPWRCGFDRVTQDLWCADVGQDAWEEVDVIVRGGNYGWRRMEGEVCYIPAVADCNADGSLLLPLTVYSHALGCSVTGGYVYRGTRLPEIQGAYIYGDYCTGRVWAVRWDGMNVVEERLVAQAGLNISSFGEDRNGELYLVHHGGTLHRLQPSTATPGTFPTTLSATGCYANVAQRTPAASAIPYEVVSPLWSDGTEKRRFLFLPGTNNIGYTERGAWDLPDGTVLMKEFLLDMERGNPATRRALETRFLVRRGSAWEGYTYRWNDAETEGLLQGDATTQSYTVTEPGGSTTTQVHYFPSRSDCLRCHTQAAGGPLGLQTAQMNRDHDYGGVIDNQLRAMEHIGLFGGALPAVPALLPRLPSPSDVAAPAEARARSYLHGNCANCHLPGGPTPSTLDLRFETSLAQTATCNAAPQHGDLGVAGALIVKPGAPSQSVLFLRMSARGTNQMPPLASTIPDPTGTSVVRDWILSLGACP
jgi:uncharacterized repeat protein (TIGR03806 family)